MNRATLSDQPALPRAGDFVLAPHGGSPRAWSVRRQGEAVHIVAISEESAVGVAMSQARRLGVDVWARAGGASRIVASFRPAERPAAPGRAPGPRPERGNIRRSSA